MVFPVFAPLNIPLVKNIVEVKEEIGSNSLIAHPEVLQITYIYVYKMVVRQFERLSAVICIGSGVRLKICPIPCAVIPAQLHSKFPINGI